MQPNLENLDPDSRKILEQAMSMDSTVRSMGLESVRAEEQRQLAADMEKKNAEARRRRGAAIAGEDPVVQAVQRQTPIKRRNRGMVKQEQVMPLTPPQITPVTQLPPEQGPAESSVDDSAMRKTFAKLTGRKEDNTQQAQIPPIAQQPSQLESVPEAPVVTQDVPKVHSVHEQELIDRPFDVAVEHPDFSVFTQVSRLPSKGLFYPDPIYGQSLKLIDNYFLDDVVDGSANTRTALNAILARRIRGIDPLDIVTIDEPYLLHWLRASSFPKHKLWHPGYVCPHCGYDTDSDNVYNDFGIGFRNLKFTLTKDIDKLYELHRENGYHTGFLDDGRECHVYIHRLRHATVLSDFISKWEKKNNITAPNAIKKAAGVATVVEIEGCENMDEKFEYITELPDSMKETFENLVVEGTVACNVSAAIPCGRCGGMVETPYPFLVRRFVSSL